VTGSLAYRKNAAAILRGQVPEKYTRILPYIQGDKIIEMGSAEGVLSLLLAKQGKQVTALELNAERHAAALRLCAAWQEKSTFAAPQFVNGSISDHLDLLDGKDTLVAVRMIYYLRAELDAVIAAASKAVKTVVLCGNKNRAAQWEAGVPDEVGGAENKYASLDGMKELLLRHGFAITATVAAGDPIVIGSR
jgi:hypothetical protein